MNVLWFSNSPCGSIRRDNLDTIKGGWLIALEDELKKLDKVKLSISYFSSKNEEPFEYEGVDYYPIYIQKGKNVIERFLYRHKSLKSIDNILLPKMLDVIETVKPNIIHIHGTEERFGLIQDYIKKIPVLFSIQGLIAPYKEKYFSGLSYSVVDKYESYLDKIKHISFKNDYESFCFRAKREVGYLKKAKYIAGRTLWDKNITLGINPNRQYFTVNEILRESFYKCVWCKESFNVRIQLISIISGGIYKGFETVLKTATLLKEYASFDFDWQIVGYDSKSKWVKISEQSTGLKHEKLNIHLLGRLNEKDLASLLVDSDVYVHVSHIENSPNSVCEAMLLGMPIIASFSGGTSSIVKNGVEGTLLQDGDPYMYAGTIVNYYNNFKTVSLFGKNARKRALVRHNPKQIVEELLTAYESVLKNEQ